MNKCAVIIGVNDTGKLPPLSAATIGAIAFNKWARSQGYDTKLLTDIENPVTVKDILTAVKSFVEERTYELMIIYFSGHGILKSAGDEHWLLSEAPNNPNEAVAILPSKLLAQNAGIPHIVFISDACRSKPEDELINEVRGSAIFPNMEQTELEPDIDIFYAARPGKPAYELTVSSATSNHKGIYTDCLLHALNGNVPGLIKPAGDQSKLFDVIMAYELKLYLKEAVPKAALAASITISQDPRAEVVSRAPKYLSQFNRNKNPRAAEPEKDNDPNTTNDTHPKTHKSTMSFNADRPTTRDPLISKDQEINLLLANRKQSDQLSTGFTITGTNEWIEIVGLKDVHIFRENDAHQIAINGHDMSAQCLLRLADGKSIPLAILKDFVGTIVIEDEEVVNINYNPTANSVKYAGFIEYDAEIQTRRAAIAVASRNGIYTAPISKEELIFTASYLRSFKEFDPTLGLYAAYAYAEAGNFRGIESIYSYMVKENEPVLFDVAMLAEFTRDGFRSEALEAATPYCPMLNKGWSYLTIKPKRYRAELEALSKYTIPGLWTTFSQKGTELYSQLLKANQV